MVVSCRLRCAHTADDATISCFQVWGMRERHMTAPVLHVYPRRCGTRIKNSSVSRGPAKHQDTECEIRGRQAERCKTAEDDTTIFVIAVG